MYTLEEIHSRATTLGRDMITKVGIGEVMPLFIGFTPDDKPLPICIEMHSDPLARDMAAILVGQALKAAGCTRYAFITETWISNFANEAATKSKGATLMLPSEQPDRVDGLMITAEDVTGRNISAQYVVKQHGDTVELVLSGDIMDTAKIAGATVSGRFVGLLKPVGSRLN
jgi:hypothetical protein